MKKVDAILIILGIVLGVLIGVIMEVLGPAEDWAMRGTLIGVTMGLVTVVRKKESQYWIIILSFGLIGAWFGEGLIRYLAGVAGNAFRGGIVFGALFGVFASWVPSYLET